ncbi:MAG: hypothetical protein OEL77_01540 [Nitrosopumilus sp.]|nr:hypothetical protein [Nitrosopumilus sp.]MDH3384677.1 hypothetical protein [Nitrosopumilus sp.]
MNNITRPNLLSAILIIVAGVMIISFTNNGETAFAESESTSTILVSEKLKNDPIAMKIIAEMEAQKLRYKQISEGKVPAIPLTQEQIEVEKTRKIVDNRLQEDLKSMNKKYLDFTPRNAFAKFVETVNETYHGIFWDQFDYLEAKVQLAIAAKNVVLENGGSFYDAQREYFKYASMPRVDMINYIEELNIKYGFANEDIQSHFDSNGKLPRFEDDKDAPCYGCENIDSNPESQTEGEITNVINNVKVKPKSELTLLQEHLSGLRQQFLDATDLDQKKSLVDSLNETVKKIQNLTY